MNVLVSCAPRLRCLILSGVLALACVHAWAAPSAEAALSGEDIYRRATEAEKVNDWRADSALEIRNGERKRVRSGVVFNRLQPNATDSQRLFRFTAPADVAGTAVLVHEQGAQPDDLWIYFPSMAKTRRILASNKKDSFMGSDFAYADLMAPDVADFEHTRMPDQPCGSATCYVVQSVPRTPAIAASLGYARALVTIRHGDFTTQGLRYFDAAGKERKQQQISGYVPAPGQPGRFVATRREMRSADGKRSSLLTLDALRANQGLAADLFVESRLGQ